MDNLTQNLESMLNNPQLMQQIMTMASSLSSQDSSPPQSPPAPAPDLAALQKIAGLATQTGIDPDQQSLLQALVPYLSNQRLHRLERAMRAAKTARLATQLLGSEGLNFLTGR